jgi:hypothetical protein
VSDVHLFRAKNEAAHSPSAPSIKFDPSFSGADLNALLDAWKTEYLLLILPGGTVELGSRALERFVQVADDSGAGLLYSVLAVLVMSAVALLGSDRYGLIWGPVALAAGPVVYYAIGRKSLPMPS